MSVEKTNNQLRNLLNSAKDLSASIALSINNNMPFGQQTWQLTEIVKQIIPIINNDFSRIASILSNSINNIAQKQLVQLTPYAPGIPQDIINMYILRDIMTTIDILDSLCVTASHKRKKGRKIFISHKSEDKAFADALVDLLRLYLKSDADKIFCSSVPNYKIGIGKDIYPEIKTQFSENEVFMIIIHSPRYYGSAICLNEMGASWILNTECYSFLTADCRYDNLKGVIDNKYISIKVNAGDANDRMNEFIGKVMDFFNLPKPDLSAFSQWEADREKFLNKVCSLNLNMSNWV